jgi:hypothetical protein
VDDVCGLQAGRVLSNGPDRNEIERSICRGQDADRNDHRIDAAVKDA